MPPSVFSRAIYAMHRTEEEKLEWHKVLVDTVRDSFKRRSSFIVGNQPASQEINVSRAQHF